MNQSFVAYLGACLGFLFYITSAVWGAPASRAHTGMENHGNTCYVNSAIQLLYSLPLVRSLVYSMHTGPADQQPVGNDLVVYELQKVFHRLQTSPFPASSDRLVAALGFQTGRMGEIFVAFGRLAEVISERPEWEPGLFAWGGVNQETRDFQTSTTCCVYIPQMVDGSRYEPLEAGLNAQRQWTQIPPILNILIPIQGGSALPPLDFGRQLNLMDNTGTAHRLILHAVCIHRPSHFWTIIYDHAARVWRRKDDTRVDQITEEAMLAAARGSGASRAVVLIYIREDELDRVIAEPSPDLVPERIRSLISREVDDGIKLQALKTKILIISGVALSLLVLAFSVTRFRKRVVAAITA